MIKNHALTEEDIQLLNYFFKHIRLEKELVLQQINSAKIIKNSTPYYIDYHLSKTQEDILPLKEYQVVSTIQIIHPDGAAPTLFNMMVKHGYIELFEICNADCSELCIDNLLKGEALVEF